MPDGSILKNNHLHIFNKLILPLLGKAFPENRNGCQLIDNHSYIVFYCY